MKKSRWRLFPYLSLDHRAAQDALNAHAAQGWMLKRIWFGVLARFVPTERKDLQYFADWTDGARREEPDYVSLCADAGWEPAALVRNVQFYASRPGADPVPIQTDGGLEYERFRKTVLRRIISVGAFLVFELGLMALLLLMCGSFWAAVCRSALFMISFWAVTLPAAAAGLALYLAILIRRLFRWRREAGAGGDLTAPRGAGPRSVLTLLNGLWWLGVTLAFFADVLAGNYPIEYLFWGVVGLAVGLALAFGKKQVRDQKRTRRNAAVMALLIVCVFLARIAFPDVWQDLLLPQVPPPPVHESLPTQPTDQYARRGTPLCVVENWTQTADLGGENSAYLVVTRYTCLTPELAQTLAGGYVKKGAAPVDVSGAWSLSSADAMEDVLILRGDMVSVVSYWPKLNTAKEAAQWAADWMEG